MSIDALPIKTFDPEITLEKLKTIEALADCPLLTSPRLSVAKLSEQQFKEIVSHA